LTRIDPQVKPFSRAAASLEYSDRRMSDCITRGIHVEARGFYVPERSNPADSYYFFAYTIRISNQGDESAQLLSRHWIISGPDGPIGEVRGDGVVGEQPVLGPGEAFEYTSFCPLQTPLGSMHGTYQMARPSGERFEAVIPPFTLAVPTQLN
jgi:ApaG protein